MISKQLAVCVDDLLKSAKSNPETPFYVWCKNCEKLLGIIVGWNSDWKGKYWDKNDTGCPFCGDNAARLSSEEDLLNRWGGLLRAAEKEISDG